MGGLEDITSGTLVSANDIHGDGPSLKAAIVEAYNQTGDKNITVVGSDLGVKTAILQAYQEMGVANPDHIRIGYTAQQIEDPELSDIYQKVEVVKSFGGIEEYLALIQQSQPSITEEQIADEANRFKDLQKQYVERDIASQIKLTDDQQKELDVLITQNSELAYGIDRSMSAMAIESIAQAMHEVKKEYGLNLNFILNKGNHDTLFEKQMISYLLTDSGITFYDGGELEGTLSIGKGKNKINFQMAGNVYALGNRGDAFAYSKQETDALYPHMALTGTQIQDIKTEQTNQINPQILPQSAEYNRITDGGKDLTKLDVLLLHKELGYPIGFEPGKSKYASIDDIGLVYIAKNQLNPFEDSTGLVVSGHIHDSKKAIKEETGNTQIRSSYVMLTKKNGKLQADILDAKPQEFTYDRARMEKLAEHYIAERRNGAAKPAKKSKKELAATSS